LERSLQAITMLILALGAVVGQMLELARTDLRNFPVIRALTPA